VKRRPARGGIPVVFLHGLAVNADLWDLPEIRTREFHFRSLAGVLHDEGYDVWLVNLRGHGAPDMLSEPAPGQTDWCVDHFVLYDLPAVLDHVQAQCGARPFVIGNSMGAMTTAACLQGAVLCGTADSSRIMADAAVAQGRQRQVAGAVFVEFPAALRWPQSVYDEAGNFSWERLWRDWRRGDGELNYPFEVLSRWSWLHALVDTVGGVRLDWLKPGPDAGALKAALPESIASAWEAGERAFVQKVLNVAGTFTGHTNHRAEVILRGRRHVIEGLKAGVLRQMAASVRRRAFVSLLGTPEHVYSEHYEKIELPSLVVAGGRDRIANAAVTREAFYDRITSSDKRFLLYDEIAHGEFEAAPIACERVYPEIAAWVNERRALAERG
jgi:pimeloyl-ACP methyl ester carboxylesterase